MEGQLALNIPRSLFREFGRFVHRYINTDPYIGNLAYIGVGGIELGTEGIRKGNHGMLQFQASDDNMAWNLNRENRQGGCNDDHR